MIPLDPVGLRGSIELVMFAVEYTRKVTYQEVVGGALEFGPFVRSVFQDGPDVLREFALRRLKRVANRHPALAELVGEVSA